MNPTENIRPDHWIIRAFMKQPKAPFIILHQPRGNPMLTQTELDRIRENELHRHGREVLIVADELRPELAQAGLTREDFLHALEKLRPEPPRPSFTEIAEALANTEKIPITADTNDPLTWKDLGERGARRPRGFAKAHGWKAKQRAKRKAQRKARQRARG